MDIAIIGGGASGFFCALNIAMQRPDAQITIFERTSTLLGKVRISGGGRCNVTHSLFDARDLVKKYPRGAREMLSPFIKFNPENTIEWFRQRGVTLKTEPDGRMFPVTDSSETIIDCFLREAEKLGIQILMNAGITEIKKTEHAFELYTNTQRYRCDAVVVAAGGNIAEDLKKTLLEMGHTFVPSVPSLFTFNVPKHPINSLMGVSVPMATVKIAGTKLVEEGPILITHWGFSGPAILRLSAWGARHLASVNYEFKFIINWIHGSTPDYIFQELSNYKQWHQQANILNSPIDIPKRLWKFFVNDTGIDDHTIWQAVPKHLLQKLARRVSVDEYDARGKTTYKDEFVTAGGIQLKELDFKTMESKMVPGLYFTGEIIDVDGITGGFNFQNAWTTAWLAANSLAIS